MKPLRPGSKIWLRRKQQSAGGFEVADYFVQEAGGRAAVDEAVVVEEAQRHHQSVQAGIRYRAPAVDGDDGLVWFWIRSHAEYERIVR